MWKAAVRPITNNGAVTLYAYDLPHEINALFSNKAVWRMKVWPTFPWRRFPIISRGGAGQLTNEATATATNGWVYDEAGNWLNAATGSKWVDNADNEIAGRLPTTSPGVTNITVTGQVEPEPDTTKWFNTWADCRGSRARVSLADGTFSLSNVPVDPGHNALRVTVTDVSGNTATQVRNVAWTSGVTEYFGHDANGNLTN